ncbi:MAG: sugar kinase [Pseudomonadota bacterium]|nr:sugar kinase [Pseudomonadota bacterium]
MGDATGRLLAIGEVMAEIRTAGDDGFALGFAGDTYNTAVYAAREIGVPGAVAYLTRVGSEPLSAALVERAAGEGIDTTHVAVDPDRNIGIYSVSTDAHGERSFHYWRADSAARRLFAVEETAMFMPGAEIIYLSGITLAILAPAARHRLVEALAARRAAGTRIAFDSNYRPKLWDDAAAARAAMQALWEVTDIALPSIDDEMELFGDSGEAAVIDRFAERSWEGIAIKRGIRGPVSPHLDAAAHPDFPPADRVVDTTAAGDSFNGGYLAAFLAGKDEAARLAAGHALAARVVGAPGAIIPREAG